MSKVSKHAAIKAHVLDRFLLLAQPLRVSEIAREFSTNAKIVREALDVRSGMYEYLTYEGAPSVRPSVEMLRKLVLVYRAAAKAANKE